jgi:hypothetical protein
MSIKFHLFSRLSAPTAAGIVAGLAFVGAYVNAFGQTLPVAGNPQEAVVQDRANRQATVQRDSDGRDGIRGVREQDNAARRTSNELNRDRKSVV